MHSWRKEYIEYTHKKSSGDERKNICLTKNVHLSKIESRKEKGEIEGKKGKREREIERENLPFNIFWFIFVKKDLVQLKKETNNKGIDSKFNLKKNNASMIRNKSKRIPIFKICLLL